MSTSRYSMQKKKKIRRKDYVKSRIFLEGIMQQGAVILTQKIICNIKMVNNY